MSGSVKESVIEAYLRKVVGLCNGMYRKVLYQARKGSPDDWCFLPGGKLIIVECKKPGEKPEPLQAEEIRTLRSYGFEVHVVDSKEQIDEIFAPYR